MLTPQSNVTTTKFPLLFTSSEMEEPSSWNFSTLGFPPPPLPPRLRLFVLFRSLSTTTSTTEGRGAVLLQMGIGVEELGKGGRHRAAAAAQFAVQRKVALLADDVAQLAGGQVAVHLHLRLRLLRLGEVQGERGRVPFPFLSPILRRWKLLLAHPRGHERVLLMSFALNRVEVLEGGAQEVHRPVVGGVQAGRVTHRVDVPHRRVLPVLRSSVLVESFGQLPAVLSVPAISATLEAIEEAQGEHPAQPTRRRGHRLGVRLRRQVVLQRVGESAFSGLPKHSRPDHRLQRLHKGGHHQVVIIIIIIIIIFTITGTFPQEEMCPQEVVVEVDASRAERGDLVQPGAAFHVDDVHVQPADGGHPLRHEALDDLQSTLQKKPLLLLTLPEDRMKLMATISSGCW
ncbi:hypothetical protein TYRP_011681 [Tyrophagus putrescentiae]|nr:hypothetical protein TYRP_011681 [Tyrophagus putrescentiae]